MTALGCAGDPDDVGGSAAALQLPTSTVLENVEPGYVTQLTPDLQNRRVYIDASGDRNLFPVPGDPWSFPSWEDFYAWAEGALGAVRGYNVQNGPAGLMFEWESRGYQFFYDSATDLFYEIGNPVLAYIGGYTGEVKIGAAYYCVDPDDDCKNGLPSYFVVEGEEVAVGADRRVGFGGEAIRYRSHMFSALGSFFFSYVEGGSTTEVYRTRPRIRNCTDSGPEPDEHVIPNIFGPGTSSVCVRFTVNPATRLSTRSVFHVASPGGYTGEAFLAEAEAYETPRVNVGWSVWSIEAWFTSPGSIERMRIGTNRVCTWGTHHNVGGVADGGLPTENGILGWTDCTAFPPPFNP